MTAFQFVIAILQISLLVWAACLDVANRLIPNWVCVVLSAAGLAGRLLMGAEEALSSIEATLALFGALFLMFSRGWLGGGDVKLLIAMAIGLSPSHLLRLIAVMAVVGGVLSAIYLTLRHLPRPRLVSNRASILRRVYALERWRILKRAPLPYGVAIACGGIWAVLTSIGA
jgi:prepilin peptidase CpaA